MNKYSDELIAVHAMLDLLYHRTSFETANSILQDGVVRGSPQRDMPDGVSLSREPKRFRYGSVCFVFDRSVIKHRHKIVPYEYGAITRSMSHKFTNAEEYLIGDLPLKRALVRIDVNRTRNYRKRDGASWVEKYKALTSVPIFTLDR